MKQTREIVKNVHFWPILTYFWPFLAKKDFSQKKGVHHMIILTIRRFNPQNKRNFMKQTREIGKNVHFWPILTSFWSFLTKKDFLSKIGLCQCSYNLKTYLYAQNHQNP